MSLVKSAIASPVKGVRVPRKKGDGEGTLKKLKIGGREVWHFRCPPIHGPDGKARQPEKILGLAKDLGRVEARQRASEFIREVSGRVAPLPKSPTFEEVWQRYFTLHKPLWSKPQIGSVEPIMRRAVLPAIGDRDIASLTREPVQAALNHMAEMPLLIGKGDKQYTRIGYGLSALKTARTYMKAVFEFANEECLMSKNPAKKLVLPATRKPSERFLGMEQVRLLLSAATGREHLTLRLLVVGGLRPAELLALRTNDIRPGVLRIDEAVKERERQATGRRIGDTKTDESDGFVAISGHLEAELRAWAETRPSGALLFPSDAGTTWRIGNYLKRVLKPLAASVGIEGLTFQCLRRTCATHFGGAVKEAQSQMRHADPVTTLRHYKKSIGEEQRAAVEAMDAKFMTKPEGGRVN